MISTSSVSLWFAGYCTVIASAASYALLGDWVTSCKSPKLLIVSTALDVVTETGSGKESNENKGESEESERLHICGLWLVVGWLLEVWRLLYGRVCFGL